jgi:hypothetical protein
MLIISSRWLGASAMVLALLFVIGCSTYPLGMTKEEWNTLTPPEQAGAREKQRLLDRYSADDYRCRQKARIEQKVKVPSGGGIENVDVQFGFNQKIYNECMDEAGWSGNELPVAIDKTQRLE